jgi:hypothetical protein
LGSLLDSQYKMLTAKAEIQLQEDGPRPKQVANDLLEATRLPPALGRPDPPGRPAIRPQTTIARPPCQTGVKGAVSHRPSEGVMTLVLRVARAEENSVSHT